jgi:hypothetical protein
MGLTLVGAGYRPELGGVFGQSTAGQGARAGGVVVECAELIADRYFADEGVSRPWELEALEGIPKVVHGLCGNAASVTGPSEAYLEHIARLADTVDALLYSDHLALTGAGGHALGHLAPNLFDDELLDYAAANIERMVAATGRRPCLENLATSTMITGSTYTPEEFYLRLLDVSADWDCLVDLTNVWINSTTRVVDPRGFVDAIPPQRIRYVHLAGGERLDGMWVDTHSNRVHDEAFDLLEYLLERATPQVVLVERDANWDGAESEVREDVERARAIVHAVAARQPAASRRAG